MRPSRCGQCRRNERGAVATGPETEERIWYARMVGRSTLGGGLALEGLVLPFLGGTDAFNIVLAATGACFVVSIVAMLVLARLERS